MTRHLSDEAVLDVAEGREDAARRAHVDGCPDCRERVETVLSGLDAARRADVPEPSPLYWEAMRRNVGRRIAEEPRRAPRWAWLAPLAATAAVVAVGFLATGRGPSPQASPAPRLAAWSALPAEEDDAALEVLEGLAATQPDMEPLDEGRGVGAFVALLSDEEQAALAASLRGAGEKGGES
jgi:hypothetical protein